MSSEIQPARLVPSEVPSKSVTEAAISDRVRQEVQAAMAIAKRFPRDVDTSFARIMVACRRRKLAEQATYVYPRGKTTVIGPSIRLAEVLAQAWGNLDFGLAEIENKPGESTMMAHCWDLETNIRSLRIFSVPHVRYTKKYGSQSLSDPRDVYEMTANQGARRMRACILQVIPGDVIDAALEACRNTLESAEELPLADRLRKMVAAFAGFGVTKEMLEKRLGHQLSVTIPEELVILQGIYRSLKDNFAAPADYFEVSVEADQTKRVKKKAAKAAESSPSEKIQELKQLALERAREIGIGNIDIEAMEILRGAMDKLGLDPATMKQADVKRLARTIRGWKLEEKEPEDLTSEAGDLTTEAK